MELVVKGKDYVRTIADINRKILEQGLVPLRILVSREEKGKRAVYLVLSPMHEEKKQFLTGLEKILSGVEKAEEACKFRGEEYTCMLFPPLVMEERAVVVTNNIMKNIVESFRNIVGEQALRVILLQLGAETGKLFYEQRKNELSSIGRLSEGLEYLSAWMTAAGWGIIVSVKVRGGNIEIKIRDNWECMFQAGIEEDSSFTRGFLRGFLEKIVKENLQVVLESIDKKNNETICTYSILR